MPPYSLSLGEAQIFEPYLKTNKKTSEGEARDPYARQNLAWNLNHDIYLSQFTGQSELQCNQGTL